MWWNCGCCWNRFKGESTTDDVDKRIGARAIDTICGLNGLSEMVGKRAMSSGGYIEFIVARDPTLREMGGLHIKE